AEHCQGTIWAQTKKKGPALSRKSLIFMARPIGFEPMTFASGGRRHCLIAIGLNRPKFPFFNQLRQNPVL
ncbi:hypothetical protein, partial [Marinobacter sp. tcs-11]|uniref:hypothetical protein n=1 Tax=Marinobacter sp. tcs-11 TaxID=1742860 RepID=UPI0025811BA3